MNEFGVKRILLQNQDQWIEIMTTRWTIVSAIECMNSRLKGQTQTRSSFRLTKPDQKADGGDEADHNAGPSDDPTERNQDVD